MFHILSPDQYSTIKPLFESISHNLVIHTMLEGHPAAKIWANDESDPTIALLWDRLDEFLFLGGVLDSEVSIQELHSILVDTIIPESVERGGSCMVLQCSFDNWAVHIPALLEGTQITTKQKILYVFDSKSTLKVENWRDKLPKDYNVLKFDNNLLGSDLENLEDAVRTTGYVWGDFDTFNKDGVGFCVSTNGKLVSRCLTDFVRGKEYELYAETKSEFRGKGLATIATAALVEHLIESENSLIWQCWGDHIASIKVAERVGFRKENVSIVYDFDYST